MLFALKCVRRSVTARKMLLFNISDIDAGNSVLVTSCYSSKLLLTLINLTCACDDL